MHYRVFDLIFEMFIVQVVLRGNEPDEIRIDGRNVAIKTRIDSVQNSFARKADKEVELGPIIYGYRDLDEFLKENYESLNEYYSDGSRNQGS